MIERQEELEGQEGFCELIYFGYDQDVILVIFRFGKDMGL